MPIRVIRAIRAGKDSACLISSLLLFFFCLAYLFARNLWKRLSNTKKDDFLGQVYEKKEVDSKVEKKEKNWELALKKKERSRERKE